MALDPMQGGMEQEMPEQEMEEPQGTEICLTVGKQGELSIRVEENGSEGEEMPVENIDQALKSIKALAQDIMSQSNPDQVQEDAAYQSEMAQGM